MGRRSRDYVKRRVHGGADLARRAPGEGVCSLLARGGMCAWPRVSTGGGHLLRLGKVLLQEEEEEEEEEEESESAAGIPAFTARGPLLASGAMLR